MPTPSIFLNVSKTGGEIAACLANHQIKILGLTVQNEALEEYYLNLTGGAKHV